MADKCLYVCFFKEIPYEKKKDSLYLWKVLLTDFPESPNMVTE
jgi:hypothetical protein